MGLSLRYWDGPDSLTKKGITMDTLIKNKTTANDLNAIIKEHLEDLAKATDKARVSDEMVRYLEFCAKFHQYSPSNIWLILMAKPDASHIAGYNAWKKVGRFVKRGEKGIAILAPMLYREDTDDEDSQKVLRGFRIVHVFDLAQTDGQPLPEAPNWKSPEKHNELQKKLIEFAVSNGIKVTIEPISGETQGISMGGRIILSPEAGTKTLIHELAHELLHQVENNVLSKAEKELEAESVAFVVCKYLGFKNLSSPNYLALHNLQGDMMFAHFQRISNLAHRLILAVDKGSN
jgi:hypothetical protein